MNRIDWGRRLHRGGWSLGLGLATTFAIAWSTPFWDRLAVLDSAALTRQWTVSHDVVFGETKPVKRPEEIGFTLALHRDYRASSHFVLAGANIAWDQADVGWTMASSAIHTDWELPQVFPAWARGRMMNAELEVPPFDAPQPVGFRAFYATGWPWRCMWCETPPTTLPSGAPPTPGGFGLADARQSLLGQKVPRALPYRPRLLGLLGNTMIFAAGWYGMQMLGAIVVRSWRTESYRCPRCGFDRHGSERRRCSECGYDPSLSRA